MPPIPLREVNGRNALAPAEVFWAEDIPERAWPKEWDVEFKLHAPQATIVEGVYRNRRMEPFAITPENRAKDVVKMTDREHQ